MTICFPLHHSKDRVFPDLRNQICFELLVPITPLGPKGPGPIEHLRALATIIQLAASLPDQLPMRDELHNLASQALHVAVADLGEDVHIHAAGVAVTTA